MGLRLRTNTWEAHGLRPFCSTSVRAPSPEEQPPGVELAGLIPLYPGPPSLEPVLGTAGRSASLLSTLSVAFQLEAQGAPGLTCPPTTHSFSWQRSFQAICSVTRWVCDGQAGPGTSAPPAGRWPPDTPTGRLLLLSTPLPPLLQFLGPSCPLLSSPPPRSLGKPARHCPVGQESSEPVQDGLGPEVKTAVLEPSCRRANAGAWLPACFLSARWSRLQPEDPPIQGRP